MFSTLCYGSSNALCLTITHSLSPEEPHVISATVAGAFQRSCASDPILFLDLSNPWESLHYNGLPVPETASEQKDESHILTKSMFLCDPQRISDFGSRP